MAFELNAKRKFKDLTPGYRGTRFGDGRPKINDNILKRMKKVTVEGADLAKEIAKKVKEDFDEKKLPLMLGMINAIVEDKKLELNWEAFR